jgi:Calcium-dependent channel, 7TM region, putative phosphate
VETWKIKMAPVMSDIIWDNLMNDEAISSLKSWILLFILFIVCVVFITPSFLIDHLKPIIDLL